jgi:hypothetical protein
VHQEVHVVRHKWLVVVIAAVVALLGLTGCTRFGATLSRPADPVVLQGSDLPKLVGSAPMHLVGFAWDGSAWHQVPVQVDERDLVSPGVIYHLPTTSYPTVFGTGTPYKIPVYTPPATASAGYTSFATYTPPDSNAAFDANDELSFLANDTGQQAGSSVAAPPGVVASSREEVTARDPLAPNQVGYVYVFNSATLTGGGAGTSGVQYTFSLDSGDYKTTYKMGSGSLAPNNTWGFNPEHSNVVTPNYTQQFGDRWLNDGLSVSVGSSTGTDILDRTHYYATAACGRTEDTFDGAAANPGEGAFVANISGPVRAIRSYIGANSYKWTVNTDIFYPDRQDTITELRGHAGLPGYGAADDYTTGTTGLTYSDPSNSGVVINGATDAFTPITYNTGSPAPPLWQMVSGPQGAVVTARTLTTDITGLKVTSVYQDHTPAATSSPEQCTGDGVAYGSNGANVTSPVNNVPNTDPTLGANPNNFLLKRFRFFGAPNTSASNAATFEQQVLHPVTLTVTG